MGLFDFLTGTKRPPAGRPVLSRQEVLARLKDLNRPTAPWHVMDGGADGVDLVAEWRVHEREFHGPLQLRHPHLRVARRAGRDLNLRPLGSMPELILNTRGPAEPPAARHHAGDQERDARLHLAQVAQRAGVPRAAG